MGAAAVGISFTCLELVALISLIRCIGRRSRSSKRIRRWLMITSVRTVIRMCWPLSLWSHALIYRQRWAACNIPLVTTLQTQAALPAARLLMAGASWARWLCLQARRRNINIDWTGRMDRASNIRGTWCSGIRLHTRPWLINSSTMVTQRRSPRPGITRSKTASPRSRIPTTGSSVS